MMIRVIAPVLLAGAIAACSGARNAGQGRANNTPGSIPEASLPAKSIDDVLAAHTDSLMALPGVVGTAIGLCDGERCIKVLLADTNPATKARIPLRLDGYRVVTEVTGTIQPR
jgi:hypothetical protein